MAHFPILAALIFFTGIFIFPPAVVQAVSKSYDVIIVGGGTSGVVVAIQAVRMGAKVALFEETDWIGGQMAAAGVSNMDEGGYLPSGIYKEFLDNVRNYYQSLTPKKNLGTCYFSNNSNCFEPAIARQCLNQMLEETKSKPLDNGRLPTLDLYLMTKVAGVLKEGLIVKGLITATGEEFDAKVVVDATEYGDVISLTGARYRAGNLTSDEINDPSFDVDKSNTRNACIQSITYSAIIKKYPNGIPSQLRINTAPPGYGEQTKKIFKSLVTEDGNANGVWSWNYHSAYRGMPNRDLKAPDANAGSETGRKNISKTSINYANDYPWIKDLSKVYANTPDPYPLTVKYLLDKTFREKINCEAKLRTLQFIYYVQNELNQPWAVADDEGYNGEYNIYENVCENIPASRTDLKTIEKYMPVMPYVRESIRIIGLHTLTAKEIKRVGYYGADTAPFRAEKQFNDSVIAVGDYAVDLHGAARNDNLETYLGETRKDKPKWRYGPFHVPFECLIPEAVDGFIAAEKNISVTRLASAATRLQPVTMRIGQAVGIIAALASRNDIQPRQVNPIAVQWKLLENGVPLLIVGDSPETDYLAYKDVPKNHHLWKYVQMMGLRKFMLGSGRGMFGVDDYLTRAQMAAISARIYDLHMRKERKPSSIDGPSNHWAYKFIEAIRQTSLAFCFKTKAYLYGPDTPVTRAQFAELVATGLKLNPDTMNPAPFFSDVPKNHEAFRFVQLMYGNDLMDGYGFDAIGKGVFLPEKNMTRGEAAAALTAIILKQGNVQS